MRTPGADFELTSRVLVPSFGGCGVQLNQHVYAKITGLAADRFQELEERVVALKPHLVRFFYNDRQAGDPSGTGQTNAQKDRWASFVRTAELAQRSGAAINVTWQSGRLATRAERETSMARFAGVLQHLVAKNGISNLRWVTLQNEPNTPPRKGQVKAVTPERLGEMYELLDRRLDRHGLREQIRFMGGDLIEGSRDPHSPLNQRPWFAYMSSQLSELLDAYSIHVYWDYDDVGRFQRRLADVHRIVGSLANRRPVFVTEYGVRGKDRGVRGVIDPGNFRDGPRRIPLCRTNIAAFQHAWFQILSAQLGYAGTVKWDCHFGRYDRGRQAYYAIGEPTVDGWPLYPMYFLLRLVTLTTGAGWRVVALDQAKRAAGTKRVAAFAGGAEEVTFLGLDTRGATLNGVSPVRVDYALGGLPPRTPLRLLLWNRAGDGKLDVDTTLTADSAGIARIRAPLHSVFALTSKALPAS